MPLYAMYGVTTPNPVNGDWNRLIEQVTWLGKKITYQSLLNKSASNYIQRGAVIQHLDVLYYAFDPVLITGTPSDYIRCTLIGNELSVQFVDATSLSVAWNSTYMGWYDDVYFTTLYLFNEVQAVLDGVITAAQVQTDYAIAWVKSVQQDLRPSAAPKFNALVKQPINSTLTGASLYTTLLFYMPNMDAFAGPVDINGRIENLTTNTVYLPYSMSKSGSSVIISCIELAGGSTPGAKVSIIAQASNTTNYAVDIYF